MIRVPTNVYNSWSTKSLFVADISVTSILLLASYQKSTLTKVEFLQ
jgi:hypothetical protein